MTEKRFRLALFILTRVLTIQESGIGTFCFTLKFGLPDFAVSSLLVRHHHQNLTIDKEKMIMNATEHWGPNQNQTCTQTHISPLYLWHSDLDWFCSLFGLG